MMIRYSGLLFGPPCILFVAANLVVNKSCPENSNTTLQTIANET